MVSVLTWLRYLSHRFHYSVFYTAKNFEQQFTCRREAIDAVLRNMFLRRLTYLHWNKGEEMVPTIAGLGGTLLVRKIPQADLEQVFVGDVVVLEDPEISGNYLVRRVAATKGYEMVSNDEKDEPFVLGKDQCWVLADNGNLTPKDANDSRTFGPISMKGIVGRVLYRLTTAVDHGPVKNSNFSVPLDSPVLEVELDVDEMAKNHKA
ncbi:mitochondrial ATP-independent inner membrane protease subunit 2-like [Cornus florida]|uniref:mitochondrial ATP-independent inner membrane protease subunit 2-like n=1 Tax=Cornus florida TaxID=4283 RepID=UPI00289DF085|nr:mitochondrial ATP-independent inner membrane protease subunit 2-like [Cornus florida]